MRREPRVENEKRTHTKKCNTTTEDYNDIMIQEPSPPGEDQNLPSSPEDQQCDADTMPVDSADQTSLMESAQIAISAAGGESNTDFAILAENESTVLRESSPRHCSSQSYYRSPEFLELSGCVCITAVALLVHKLPISPHQREMPVQYLESSGEFVLNQSYNEPLVSDTVSNVTCILLAVVVPCLVQCIVCYFTSKKQRRIQDLHNTACVYMLTFGITILTTEFIKLYAGYLRPVFFDYCEPDANYQECTSDAAHNGENYRMSFPSGHASASFCGLTLLTLYLHTHFGVATKRVYKQVAVAAVSDIDNDDNDIGSNAPCNIHRLVAEFQQPLRYTRLISILALLPMGLAIFIAASRVQDNKHFPADVVGGSVLGASVAVYVNGLWFP
jgi:diacylglycerol diphosphate phosphatase / phosphatidate phosphatase